MYLKKQINSSPILSVGLIFLAIANLAHFYLPRITGTTPDSLDFVFGLLMGISIALLLLSIVIHRRTKST